MDDRKVDSQCSKGDPKRNNRRPSGVEILVFPMVSSLERKNVNVTIERTEEVEDDMASTSCAQR